MVDGVRDGTVFFSMSSAFVQMVFLCGGLNFDVCARIVSVVAAVIVAA